MAMKIIIVGGGASGMAAAITASAHGEVTLLERSSRLGRKLSVTGNGRCNLTNMKMSPSNYHGEDASFSAPALTRFDPTETRRFFRSIGLLTVEESSGRVYPHSDQAGSVVDVLRFAASRAANIRTGFEVTGIKKDGSGFEILSPSEALRCDRLIIAAGGLAGTRAGGSASGYDLLRSLGHTCTKLYPALVQLKTENTFTRPLKGVRADAGVQLRQGGRVIAESAGEVQFTDYGLSGPAIFEISREAVKASAPSVRLDLMRGLSAGELFEMMDSRRPYDLSLENLLTGILHNKLGRTIVSSLGHSLQMPISSLSKGELLAIAEHVKCVELRVTGSMGMDGAQVTAGGIRTDEFDPNTLESRLVSGLYACGEVLDIDGDCGGYNLQWAWSSGRAAGELRHKELL